MDEEDSILDGRLYTRRLMYHEDSDSLFETRTDLEWESCIENECDEVTDLEEFESLFREQEAEKAKIGVNDPEISVN